MNNNKTPLFILFQDALTAVVEQLEGFSAAAGSWERDIIPARLDMYTSDMLDTLCAIGKSVWLRLNVRAANGEKRTSPIRNAPVTLLDRSASGARIRVEGALPLQPTVRLRVDDTERVYQVRWRRGRELGLRLAR